MCGLDLNFVVGGSHEVWGSTSVTKFLILGFFQSVIKLAWKYKNNGLIEFSTQNSVIQFLSARFRGKEYVYKSYTTLIV